MSDDLDDDEEGGDPSSYDPYFAELLDDATLTGKEPKFVKVPELEVHHAVYTDYKINDLIGAYRGIRDQLATDRKGYKAREAKLKTQMSIISMQLRDRGDAAGVDSFATELGTAFRQMKEKFSIADWNLFTEWLYSKKYWHAIQKRVSPNAIKDIRDKEGLPPGVSVLAEIDFTVRAPTGGKKKRSL
jgi:hypothetical protein